MAPESSSLLPNPYEFTSPFTVVSLSHITKLTPTNYLPWKLQIKTTLESFDRYKFLDGTHPTPTEYIASDDDAAKPTTNPGDADKPTKNPTFLSWKKQNHLLYDALLGTLSAPVVSLVTQTVTTRDIWTLLDQTFAKASWGHIKQLKEKLRSSTKGNQTITYFICSIKVTGDMLSSIGSHVHQEDLTNYVLRRLDESYKPVIDGVNARDTAISFEELHEKLINLELSLSMAQRAHSGPSTALYAQGRSAKPRQHQRFAKAMCCIREYEINLGI